MARLMLAVLAVALTVSCATLPPNTDRCEYRCWQRLESCRRGRQTGVVALFVQIPRRGEAV